MSVVISPSFEGKIMALQLYRRYRKECEAGGAVDSQSGRFEEGRRGWKHCASPIHATGSIAGKFSRQSTGEWDWEQAKSVATAWESAGSWPSEGSQPEPKPAPVVCCSA